MILAHKIRINPTPEQETYFNQASGIKRFVYNWGLDFWKSSQPNWIAPLKKWTCPNCNETHDRDLNAAINIEREAMRLVSS